MAVGSKVVGGSRVVRGRIVLSRAVREMRKAAECEGQAQDGDEAFQRKLQFLMSAIFEMPEMKVELKRGFEASHAHLEKKSIVVWLKPHETGDCGLGKAFHEGGHLLFTKRIPDEAFNAALGSWSAALGPDAVDGGKRRLRALFNILEDFRIERAIPKYFPSAEFYIKTMNQELFGHNEWPIGQFRDPMANLQFLLAGIDMVKFVPDKGARRAVRKAEGYLRGARFDECLSSEELWPHVLNVFNILMPYLSVPKPDEEPEPQSGSMDMEKGVPHPRYEVADGKDTPAKRRKGDGEGEPKPEDECSGDGEGKGEGEGDGDGDGGSDGDGAPEDDGKPKPRPASGGGKRGEDGEEDGKLRILGRTFLEPPKTKDWRRTPRAAVRTVKECRRENMASCEPVTDIPNLVSRGQALGRMLKRELRLKEDADRRRSSGKLDIRELRRQLAQHGEIATTRVFMRDVHSKHAHTVSILIDFSGSMGEQGAGSMTKLKAAKSAALVLSSCLDEMRVPHSVAGFSAIEGRLEVVHYEIKPFTGKLNVARLQDFNYLMKPVALQNRDGDSVRHAAALLRAYGKGTKVLFVISDGQPHHPDGVEGKREYNYGYNSRADVMAAVLEAERMGVQVIGVAIEPEAAKFINETYRKGFHIGKVDELPDRLLNIYRRVIRPIMR